MTINNDAYMGEYLVALNRIATALEAIAGRNGAENTINEQAEMEEQGKTNDDVLGEFLAQHEPQEFINLKSKKIHDMLVDFCNEKGYENIPGQKKLTFRIKKDFAKVLDWDENNKSGTKFTMRK